MVKPSRWEMRDAVRQHRLAGLTVGDISRRLGVSRQNVSYHIKRMDLPAHLPGRTPRRRWTPEEDETLRQALAEGLTYAQMAEARLPGRSIDAIAAHAQDRGFIARPSEEQRVQKAGLHQRIVALYCEGVRPSEIAKTLGISKNIIAGVMYRQRERLGITARVPAEDRTSVPPEEVALLLSHLAGRVLRDARKHAPTVLASRPGCLAVEFAADGSAEYCGQPRKRGSHAGFCRHHHAEYLAPAVEEI